MPEGGMAIRLESVFKSYFMDGVEIPVIADLSMDLPAGSITGFVGASGTGKSTLLHLLGLLDIRSICGES